MVFRIRFKFKFNNKIIKFIFFTKLLKLNKSINLAKTLNYAIY